MKILNLYAGIGGNRKLWEDEHDITSVEYDPYIASVYKDFYPKDKVIVADAHEYLKEHFNEFDFIWSSPPCPSHSRMRMNHKIKIYPDMKLYQEIIFLKHFFKGKWVVENVIPYYEPLIKPTVTLHRHNFWSNFEIEEKEYPGCNVAKATKETLAAYHDIPLWEGKNHRLLLRNCVYPPVGEYILNKV